MSDEQKTMKASNYLDNDSNDNWEWHNDGEKVEIVTIHEKPKPHMHKADITQVSIGEMIDNPDPIIGEAHRNSPHYYKDGTIKPPKNNKRKDSKDMSSKEHQAFCESLNPANYGNSTGPTKTTQKKGSNSEDEGKGQRERSLTEAKNTNAVKQMKSDMKTESSKTQSSKQNTAVKAQSTGNKGSEGKGGNTANGSVGKGGNVTGGKGGSSTGGKGGVGTSGHGSLGGSSGGGHGGGPGGGSAGGHGGGPGGGSRGGGRGGR